MEKIVKHLSFERYYIGKNEIKLLPFSAFSLWIYKLYKKHKRVFLLLESLPQVYEIKELLQKLTDEVYTYISLRYGAKTSLVETQKAIYKLVQNNTQFIVITDIYSFVEKIFPHNLKTIDIKLGDKWDINELIRIFSDMGYSYQDKVYEAFEFARRGGILDIYSPIEKAPSRIEFFDDEIASIRLFSLKTQLSFKTVNTYRVIEKIKLSDINDGRLIPVGKLIPDDTIFISPKLGVVLKNIESLKEELSKRYSEKEQERLFSFEIPDIKNHIRYYDGYPIEDIIPIRTGIRSLKELRDFIDRLDGYKIFLVSQNRKIISEIKKSVSGDIEVISNKEYKSILFKGDMVCIISSDFIGLYDKGGGDGNSYIGGVFDVALRSGDFVVYEDYGIARFRGIVVKTTNEGYKRDYIKLEYADSTIYIPTENIHKLERYVGLSDEEPVLDKIGSKSWDKKKKKAIKSIEKFAGELLTLYAARKLVKGYRFSEDTELQKKFELQFPYEETIGQMKAIEDVKRDMESEKPMDRLILGDVGFGKTEIAIRASFKAVCDNKQVLVLCPTTILANQHYKNFLNRTKSFGVNVALFTRLTPKNEEKKIIEGIRNHKIDIVIATHKILRDDIIYADLGLLIIDEEQKFGILQKEYIRKLKQNIDTLYLTATPIPRTLYLALNKVKDISIIETPPSGRLPVITDVLEYDNEVVRDAIDRELQRGGQIFYVHNNIKRLPFKRDELLEINPYLKIALIHSKMHPDEIEDTIMNFIDGKYHLLLSTTIIENGIDMPRVNTLFVDNSERFGLSTLYQLRGRIGRSTVQAYAYFFYDKKNLSPKALERIKALKEFSRLGSGYELALRDLKIRGAGEILGKEQSGFINKLGFHLYTKLLKDIISSNKSNRALFLSNENLTYPKIHLNIDSYIPDDYIPNTEDRLKVYYQLNTIETSQQLFRLQKEIRDFYGVLPDEVKSLFKIHYLRLLLRKIGIFSLSVKDGIMKLIGTEVAINKLKGVLIMEKEVKEIIKEDKNVLMFSLRKGKEYIEDLERIFLELVDDV